MKGEYYAAIKKRCGYYLRKINMKLKVIKEHLGKMYRYIHAYISTRKNWEAIHQNLDRVVELRLIFLLSLSFISLLLNI